MTDRCQKELHTWGRANQVVFDAKKESKHILKLQGSEGTSFTLLGVLFDDALSMCDAVGQLVQNVTWKLRTLMRTKRFYTDADLVMLYKAHLLGYIEYRTPAIYHATQVVLDRLDAVQSRFLRKAGVSEVDALVNFRLAPLSVRRDIAMLGVIHRSVLGRGPEQFHAHFVKKASYEGKHRRQLCDPRETLKHPVVKRSILGLVAVYNMLPAALVEQNCLHVFQGGLQHLVTERAKGGYEKWKHTLSPRVPLQNHPLKL
jgi:hypothetical protein